MSSKVPGPQVGLTDLVDHLLVTDDTKYSAFPLRPSNAGRCSRALAYELYEYLGKAKFTGESKTAETKRLLDLGTPIEYHVIKNMNLIPKANPDFKITYKQQVLLAFQLDPANAEDKNPPLIKGSLDFGVENQKERWTIFCDSKSAKDKFSQAFQTKWDETLSKLTNMSSVHPLSDKAFWVEDLEAFLEELNDPFFSDNFVQLNVYCVNEFAKTINVVAGSIIKYNKNDSRWFEVRFKPNANLAKQFQDKCNLVYKAAMNGTEESIREMGCDFQMGSIKRAFCACTSYSGENKEESLQAYFRTFPKRQWATDVGKLKAQQAVATRFEKYLEALDKAAEAEREESAIIDLLSKEKCAKIRLEDGQVFEVKHFKTGGISNGPRVALKRAKA